MTISGYDWIFWTAGAAIALAGLFVLILALFADRASGRRRCPRCWYDMSGAPGLCCSECGHDARRERRLGKTRRRWRRAIAAALIMFTGTSVVLMPSVRQGGFKSVVPSTVLVLSMPGLTAKNGTLASELERRRATGRLWDWQVSLLYRRMMAGRPRPWSVDVISRQRWPEDVTPRFVARFRPQATGVPWINAGSLRARVEADVPGAEPVIVFAAGNGRSHFAPRELEKLQTGRGDLPRWRERMRRLGPLEAGDHVIDIDFRIELASPDGTGGIRWVKVATETHELSLRVDGVLADVIEPVASPAVAAALEQELWVYVHEETLRVLRTFRYQPELGPDAALGLEFELVRGARTIATTSGWWNNDDAKRESEPLRWESGGFDVEDMRRHPEVEWSLRIVGRPELALLTFDARSSAAGDATRAWVGEATITLRLADPWYGAYPQRQYVPTPRWAWAWAPSGRER